MKTYGTGHNSGDVQPFNENPDAGGADTKPKPQSPCAPKSTTSVKSAEKSSMTDDDLVDKI